jgi:hypothetical protein
MNDSIRIKALKAAALSQDLTPEEKSQLTESLRQYKVYRSGGKCAFLFSLVFAFDWKKNPGYFVRELPVAIAAVAGCLAINKLAENYVWKGNEELVRRVTGFNGEMFVSAESMKDMKEMYKVRKAKQEELTVQDADLIN